MKIDYRTQKGQISNTNLLKMKVYDEKLKDTDVMNTEQILRLIPSRAQLEKETGKSDF